MGFSTAQMQYYPNELRIVDYDYQNEPIYEGEEYVEYEGEKIKVDDMQDYAKEYLFSQVYVAGEYL